jgi:hypothetical protein
MSNKLQKSLELATDELNVALKEAETTIASFNIGVSASVTIWIDPLGEATKVQQVIFGKRNQQWGLYYYEGPLPRREDGREVPLTSASRAIRIRAAGYLPQLFQEMLREAQQQIDVIQEQTEKVRAFVTKLRDIGNGAKETTT